MAGAYYSKLTTTMTCARVTTPALVSVDDISNDPATYVALGSPFARAAAWSAARAAEFVRAKLDGAPSQSITFVRSHADDAWLLLDGHERVRALLNSDNPAAGSATLLCEMVVLGIREPSRWKQRALELRANLNNLSMPVSWADRMAMRCQLESASTVAGLACAAQRAMEDDTAQKRGRPSTGARICRALQRLHGLLHPNARTTRPAPGLLARPSRTTRSLSLVALAELVLVAARQVQGSDVCYDDEVEAATAVAQQFESMTAGVRALPAALRPILLRGQQCASRKFTWLPGCGVLPFLLARANDATWWQIFARFLSACKERPATWDQFLKAPTTRQAAQVVEEGAASVTSTPVLDPQSRLAGLLRDLLTPQLVSDAPA